jgi:hypothetical protein
MPDRPTDRPTDAPAPPPPMLHRRPTDAEIEAAEAKATEAERDVRFVSSADLDIDADPDRRRYVGNHVLRAQAARETVDALRWSQGVWDHLAAGLTDDEIEAAEARYQSARMARGASGGAS